MPTLRYSVRLNSDATGYTWYLDVWSSPGTCRLYAQSAGHPSALDAIGDLVRLADRADLGLAESLTPHPGAGPYAEALTDVVRSYAQEAEQRRERGQQGDMSGPIHTRSLPAAA